MNRALLVLTLLLPVARASSQQPAPPPQTQPPAQAGPKRHIKGYVGFRTDGSTDFVLGAEFSRRQGAKLSLAGFTEFTFADDLMFALGATLQWHTRGRLYFETGPGFEFDGGSDFFWRVGAGYELAPVGLTITPKAYLDFINGDTVLGYGVSLGRKY